MASSSRRSISWSGCSLSGLAAVFLAPLLLYSLLVLAGSFLVVTSPTQSVDAIVVLSGGEKRLLQAARLYRQLEPAWFLITETGERIYGNPLPVSVLQAQEAERYGVPPEAIIIAEENTINTAGEARSVRAFVEAENVGSVLLVTDPFHTRRASLVFQRILAGTGAKVLVYPVQDHPYRAGTWFLSSEWRAETVREYGKILLEMGRLIIH